MEKIFITVTVLYALFVALFLFRAKTTQKRKKDIIGRGSSGPEPGKLKTNIIGKSKFTLSHSLPEATTSSGNEIMKRKANIFDLPNGTKVPAKVPPEELDETFSNTSLPDEDNEPMDIDYPLEYETDEGEPEEEETEEVEGAVKGALASGVRFEDLGNVVYTVTRKEKATGEQRKAAGNTLLEIRRTDMFEQLVSEKPDRRETVTSLIAESLAAFHRRKDKEAGNKGSGKTVPGSFNIRDFI